MFQKLLAAEFAPYGALSTLQLTQLEAHFTALTKWNARLNLTRIRDLQETVQFHYCESLFLGQSLPQEKLRIADIGSGGGFPGIPVAILRPDCEVTLVESHQRKSVFLREATRELKNVQVLASRAEDLKSDFDWIISRAVTPQEVLDLKNARQFSLLIGSEDAEKLRGSSKLIPWGNRRVLFHVEHQG
jgi:16S rRNA (guanine(527)-N(7))-methyltransferase RsmG